MFLKNLSLFNFKNYTEAEFQFEQGANAITGENGSGKTNILDAIHYLCLCKSYFHSTDSLNIRHEQGFFSIHGHFDIDGNSEDIFVGLKSGQKKIVKRNQKEYQRLGEHIGFLPVVMVAPVDHELITGSSELRRKLMDSIICQYDRPYLDDLINYNRVLQQRNAMLKQTAKGGVEDPSLWLVWDEQLNHYGARIFAAREHFIERFVPLFNRFYNYLTQEKETVSVKYESQLQKDSLLNLLQRNAQRDRMMQYTTAGIQRDDLELLLNDYPVKRTGSQGQQKSFVLAMKLAQFELMREAKGVKPILLMDDIFDKLDVMRITRLMELVSQDTFGQIFITDTREDHVKEVFKSINVPLQIYPCLK
ncbi:DNA replication and repair protein RecF [soil metagenome]